MYNDSSESLRYYQVGWPGLDWLDNNENSGNLFTCWFTDDEAGSAETHKGSGMLSDG